MAIVAGLFFLRRKGAKKRDAEVAAAATDSSLQSGKPELAGESAVSSPSPLATTAEADGKPRATTGTAELASTKETVPPAELCDGPKSYELDGTSTVARGH
jgi:hypothetical protein